MQFREILIVVVVFFSIGWIAGSVQSDEMPRSIQEAWDMRNHFNEGYRGEGTKPHPQPAKSKL